MSGSANGREWFDAKDHRPLMPRIRDLKGVAHDLVDHAMSGLSFLHPHVGNYAREVGIDVFTIDLLDGATFPSSKVPQPLQLALESLRSWFQPLLASYGFRLEDLASAKLAFGAFGSTPYVCAARASITTSSGREFHYERGWPVQTKGRDPT
jgi:hypothetical protein